jgi:hypothetical protein
MDSPFPDCNGGWEQSAGLAVNQIALDGKMIHGWEFTKDLVVWMHGFTAGVEKSTFNKKFFAEKQSELSCRQIHNHETD